MFHELPPDLQERIRAQIDAGDFHTEEEVLREAMNVFERHQAGLKALRDTIQEAEDDIAWGRVARFDVEKTKQAIRERLQQRGIVD